MSSVTDSDDNYINTVVKATKSDDIFRTFKSIPEYTEVLEHVNFDQGMEYLRIIQKENPQLLDKMHSIATNDTIGCPRSFFYPALGRIVSPTTLRYTKVVSDVIRMFGMPMRGVDVVEIGTGYGGQCKVFHDCVPTTSYTLFDLPEVLELNKKYLKSFDSVDMEKLTFMNGREIIGEVCHHSQFDLVLSNYAISECNDDIIRLYMDTVISKSKRGYLTVNISLIEYRREEFMKKLSSYHTDVVVEEEIPLTGKYGIIVTWGRGLQW